MGFLSVVPAWAWRWLSILLILVGAFAAGAAKMHAHDQAKFDEFEAAVKAAGDKQNALTQETVKAHKTLQELSDAEAKTAAAERDAATLRVRQLVQAGRDSRIVPNSAPSSPSNSRICYADREQLDRGLRESFARLSERVIGIAQEGQRSADVAALCRDWAKKL